MIRRLWLALWDFDLDLGAMFAVQAHVPLGQFEPDELSDSADRLSE